MHCYASIDKKCFVSRAFCLLTTVFMSLLFASSAHAYTTINGITYSVTGNDTLAITAVLKTGTATLDTEKI